MSSVLNSSLQSIDYVSVGGNKAVVSISDSAAGGAMLVDSVGVQAGRGTSLKHFLNGSTALFVGKGQGTVTINGLFGSKEQMTSLLGSSNTDPCKLSRTISLSAGILKQCSTSGDVSTSTDATLTLHGCVVQSFNIGLTMQQDGQVYQQASVQMLLTDISID